MGLGDFFKTAGKDLESIGKTAIGQVAPGLLQAILGGGPIAALASMALAPILKTDPDKVSASTIDDLAAEAAKTNPQILVDLRNADNVFQKQMSDAKIDLAKLNSGDDDRANARARQIALPQDWTPSILAGAVTIGFFGMLAILSFHEVPAGSKPIIFAMTGSLGTAWIAIVTYYFGSSRGSSAKDSTISTAFQASIAATNKANDNVVTMAKAA